MMSIEIETGIVIDKPEELFDLFKPTEGLTSSIGSMFANLMEQVSCEGRRNGMV